MPPPELPSKRSPHPVNSDPDHTFQRFLNVSDNLPLFDLSLPFALAWNFSNDLLYRYNSEKTLTALQLLLPNVPSENLKSLRLDNTGFPLDGEWLFKKLMLGKCVTIRKNAKLIAHGGIELSDGSTVGQGALLITVSHPIYPTQRHLIKIDRIHIGSCALVGANATVLCTGKGRPMKIGDHTIILPNAVVTKNIPEYSIAEALNKIILTGKEYFIENPTGNSLRSRLTPIGVERLVAANPELNLDQDLSHKAELSQNTYDHIFANSDSQTIESRRAFFKHSTAHDVDTCFLVAPLYFEGTIPQIFSRSIFNANTTIKASKRESVQMSADNLFAVNTQIHASGNHSIKLDPCVWVGANSKIIAAHNNIHIGYGSIVAATSIIHHDVKPMTIVGNHGQLIRPITDSDKYELPNEWNDVQACALVRKNAIAEMERMSPTEQLNWVKKYYFDTHN